MQGVFIHDSRPKTKKALREAVELLYLSTGEGDPYSVVMEATSFFGNEYDGSLANAPQETVFSVVGPDPRRSRKWYATIKFNQQKGQWVVT